MNIITIGQQFEMGKLVAEKLGAMRADGEVVQAVIKSPDHPFWVELNKHFDQKIKKLFSFLKTVTVGKVKAKKTTDCFTDKKRYYYRDGDLDKFLPKVQREQPDSQFTVCALAEVATFKQMAESFLGVTGDIKTLARLLKGRGYTTTLPSIEALVGCQENGEDVGLRTDGW
ncbi:MAG: hypothetical protein CEO19_413, partial [Parcubacteria group bacterium Gr01-1014_73]